MYKRLIDYEISDNFISVGQRLIFLKTTSLNVKKFIISQNFNLKGPIDPKRGFSHPPVGRHNFLIKNTPTF